LILKAFSKSKAKHVITREAAAGLAEDCVGFEQAAEYIPILSLYEKSETRTGGPFGQRKLV
jgi:hypothetical protein